MLFNELQFQLARLSLSLSLSLSLFLSFSLVFIVPRCAKKSNRESKSQALWYQASSLSSSLGLKIDRNLSGSKIYPALDLLLLNAFFNSLCFALGNRTSSLVEYSASRYSPVDDPTGDFAVDSSSSLAFIGDGRGIVYRFL